MSLTKKSEGDDGCVDGTLVMYNIIYIREYKQE